MPQARSSAAIPRLEKGMEPRIAWIARIKKDSSLSIRDIRVIRGRRFFSHGWTRIEHGSERGGRTRDDVSASLRKPLCEFRGLPQMVDVRDPCLIRVPSVARNSP